MKKVIFISALALAAAVSCNKSEIVDTKFNEQISFETYTGRDAMTKATVASTADVFGIYGYYTGTLRWSNDQNQNPNPPANLWASTKVTNGTPATPKYWTNATDYYSFIGYAPYDDPATEGNVEAPTTVTGNPVITFTVPNALTSQSDLLYSNNKVNTNRGEVETDGSVKMQFKHALSRITVKAAENHNDYTYTITGLSLTGKFIESNKFDLKEGKWSTTDTDIEPEEDSYNFILPENGVNVDGESYVECIKSGEYLMVIPVDLSKEEGEGEDKTYPDAASLAVTYTSSYGTVTSAPITKIVKVAQKFDIGKAYSLNITFGPNPDDAIKFSVEVLGWDTPVIDVTPNPENPEQGA